MASQSRKIGLSFRFRIILKKKETASLRAWPLTTGTAPPDAAPGMHQQWVSNSKQTQRPFFPVSFLCPYWLEIQPMLPHPVSQFLGAKTGRRMHVFLNDVL